MWFRRLFLYSVVVALTHSLTAHGHAQEMTLFVNGVVEDRPVALIDVVDFGVSVTREIADGGGGPSRGTLGHSYYGEQVPVLVDLLYLLQKGVSPAERFLQRQEARGQLDWRIIKGG